MSDILQRLHCTIRCDIETAASGCHCAAARDEITRLRAENERLRAANETWASAYHAEYYANERLRIELLTIAGHPELYGTKAPDIARAALDGQPAPGKEEV